MDYPQKPKIELYVQRTFGDKITATFEFIKENWKPLLKYVTYLILPVCLIQALGLNGMMSSILTGVGLNENGIDNVYRGIIIPLGTYGLFYLVGFVVLTSLIYALMRTYGQRTGRLKDITLKELRPLLMHNVKRVIIVGVLLFVFFMAYCTFLAIIGNLATKYSFVFLLAVLILLLFAIFIPLSLLIPIYLLEEISFWNAFSKALRLGFMTWGGTFAILFILGIIVNVLQSVTSMPWYIMLMVKEFLASNATSTANPVTPSIFYNFGLYLLGVVQSYGMYLSIALFTIGITFQYGHAAEKIDGVSVGGDIDNFEHLNDGESDSPSIGSDIDNFDKL
jgi:hypothetical protein